MKYNTLLYMAHRACAVKPLPPHIHRYFQLTTTINCVALAYTLKTCADKGDFSFIQWPVVLWSIISNVMGIFVEQSLVPRTGLYIKVYSSIILSFIWILIGSLKLCFSKKQKNR
jgi:hypothetical protein